MNSMHVARAKGILAIAIEKKIAIPAMAIPKRKVSALNNRRIFLRFLEAHTTVTIRAATVKRYADVWMAPVERMMGIEYARPTCMSSMDIIHRANDCVFLCFIIRTFSAACACGVDPLSENSGDLSVLMNGTLRCDQVELVKGIQHGIGGQTAEVVRAAAPGDYREFDTFGFFSSPM